MPKLGVNVNTVRRSLRKRRPAAILRDPTTVHVQVPRSLLQDVSEKVKFQNVVQEAQQNAADENQAQTVKSTDQGYVYTPEAKVDKPEEEADLDQLLSLLKMDDPASNDTASKPTRTLASSRSTTAVPCAYPDPLIYLRGHKAKKQALEICDYVDVSTPVYSNAPDDTAGIIDHIVKVKSGPKKPKLEDLSVAEWSLANVRIMDILYDPPGPEVCDYWAYTAKVLEMFRVHDRVFVLRYDRKYRELQAASQFRWGLDLPHIDITTVNTKTDNAQRGYAYGSPKGPRPSPTSSGDVHCKMYNRVSGCAYGNRCNYGHICAICGSKHPAFTHHSRDTPSSDTFPAGPPRDYGSSQRSMPSSNMSPAGQPRDYGSSQRTDANSNSRRH
jgi:hypothetical protein